MTISLKVRTKKLTEDDIILETPDLPNETATWVWRKKGIRAEDIMNVEMLDKPFTVVTIWDYIQDRPRRLLVKEPFDEVMFKWELAMTEPVIFEREEEKEPNSEEEDD